MIPATILLSLLVSFLPAQTLGNLNNENLEHLGYAYIRAVDEGISPVKFIRLIECESNFNSKAIGDKGKANGLLQFWKGTFTAYAKEYELIGNYKNPYSQINLSAIMIGDGLWYHWRTCGERVKLNK